MADFYQNGIVTTLHRLTKDDTERLESDLQEFSRNKPIGLVLPALYSEFETLAMQRIVSQLKKVRYLQRIVVALGAANEDQFYQAREFFRRNRRRHQVDKEGAYEEVDGGEEGPAHRKIVQD